MTPDRRIGGRVAILTIALLFALLGWASSGDALPIPLFTGNTYVSDGQTDGTVNYAVFMATQFALDPAAMAILPQFRGGLGSPVAGLDLTPGGFVYLFQPTNNGPNATTISTFSTGIGTAPITSWGYFTDRIFRDNFGISVNAGNNLGDDTFPVNGSDMRTGISPIDFASSSPALEPWSVVLTSSSVRARYAGILNGATSSLIVYTSPWGPGLASAQLTGGGTSADGPAPGTVPAPVSVPEPGTLLFLGLGLIGLAFFGIKHCSSEKGGLK